MRLACDFLTIQAAVDAANPGDTIRVEDSVHTENNISIAKDVNLEGFGMDVTTIQGAISTGGTPNTVIIISGWAWITIKNLTIRHGGQPGSSPEGGMRNSDGFVTLDKVRVQFNQSATIGSIANFGTMTILDSHIINNTGGNVGDIFNGEFLSFPIPL